MRCKKKKGSGKKANACQNRFIQQSYTFVLFLQTVLGICKGIAFIDSTLLTLCLIDVSALIRCLRNWLRGIKPRPVGFFGFKLNFLGDGNIANEAKILNQVDMTDLRELDAFIEEHHPKHAFCISLPPKAKKIALSNGVRVIDLPWQDFIQKLWSKEII